ncbi:hypothetical protein GIB67_032391 [Kingdonia uniflora]|uniref:RING-type E3 ubiquitin transferase n=1 Tax=Kingdonia uniflora TaxID=39325 RepID=A0A7J7MIN8_9MAGN|nr:hypothetical protein GIB67_032391 [Kingdonia uniflora]
MDIKSIKCLINSISRFIHLVACKLVKTVLIQKNHKTMVGILKLLKPVLDEVCNSEIVLNEILVKEIEELDVIVNEARDFREKWSPKASKIWNVLQSESLTTKVHNSSLKICRILCTLFQASPFTSHLASVQNSIQVHGSDQDKLTELIEASIKDLRDNLIPQADNLIKIAESLGLTSNQELLMESVALEKERANAQLKKNKEELDLIGDIMSLVEHIRDWMAKLKQFEAINGLIIPPYFRCPLSMGLMLDPVIVASGQTYESSFIQRWLEHGLTICPKTRQVLTHTNLIPNYTVKALIINWCNDNNIKISDTFSSTNISAPSLSHHVSSQDFTRIDSFCGSSHSTNSSLEAGNGSQKPSGEVSSKYDNQSDSMGLERVAPNHTHLSPEQSYTFSKTESGSSAISGIEYVSGHSGKVSDESDFHGEITSKCTVSSPSSKSSKFSPWLSGKQFHSSNIGVEVSEDCSSSHHRSLSFPFTESNFGFDDLTTFAHVKKLVEDLKSPSNEVQSASAAELRLFAKHTMENRVIIGQCGAIAPLVSLLYSLVKMTQEHAVTALLNLSINEENKVRIAESGAIEPLIHVLNTGNMGAKENSAATLFSLSVLEEYKIKIGRSAAVKSLVNLLESGTLRGKKDAATALFNLSIFHENKARIVQAGAVKYLIELMDPEIGMLDKAVALLANLSTIPEGCSAIAREGGIPVLVEVVETGSDRGKENAASILMQLCLHSHKLCNLVLQEGAIPPLVALSQSGTLRARQKVCTQINYMHVKRKTCLFAFYSKMLM